MYARTAEFCGAIRLLRAHGKLLCGYSIEIALFFYNSKLWFSDLFVVLQIAVTLPVTSCECERSFSIMRRLRTWLRASMTSERLSALALIDYVVTYIPETSSKEIRLYKFLQICTSKPLYFQFT